MDPLTAIQCASAILSFVDFGLKLVSKGREIYKSTDGVLADHAEQDAIAKRLSVLSDGLVMTIDKINQTRHLTPAERTLQQIANECNAAALEFSNAIDELRVIGKHRKWKSFRQLLKNLWAKDEIERKRLLFENLRQEILTHVLVVVHNSQSHLSESLPARIDSASRAIIDVANRHGDELKVKLDILSHDLSIAAQRPVRQFTGMFAKQSSAITDFRKIGVQWMTQHESKLEQIIEQLKAERDQRINAKLRLGLLKSLTFEQMYDRLDDIGPKARKTLEWAVSSTTKTSVPWTDLHKWLQSQEGIYWIVGKAGSGKSTMVKWLAEDIRVRNLLQIWAKQQKLLILRYFFWSAGSALQSSSNGFLRSVLHDLLLQYPSTLSSFSSTRSRSADLELEYSPPWSIDELVVTTKAALGQLSQSSKICLFIDGLDECIEGNGHRKRTLDFINQTSMKPYIKIVTSSRPLHDIDFEVQATPDLCLEDLTADDIKTYVESAFTLDKRFTRLLAKDRDLATDLATEITKRAEGVFLWVKIIVESLLRGLRNNDAASDLLRRLHETPPELESLFGRMLSAVEPVYRVKALKLLKIVLEQPQAPSLMTCSYLDEFDSQFSVSLSPDTVSLKELRRRLSISRNRIQAQCLGILEIRRKRPSEFLMTQAEKMSFGLLHGESVELLHFSAREYLMQKYLLLYETQEVADFDTDAFMVEALLAQMKFMAYIDLRLIFHFLTIVARMPRPLSEHVMGILVGLNETLRAKCMPEDKDDQAICIVYSINGDEPLFCMAVSYNIIEYVKLVASLRPASVTAARPFPLLFFAHRRTRMDMIRHGRSSASTYGYISSDDVPNPLLIRLLLEKGADPNACITFERYLPGTDVTAGLALGVLYGLSVCDEASVWDDFSILLGRDGAQIRAQGDQAIEAWVASTRLLLEYGAGHRTSIFPKQWLSTKPLPPKSMVVAYGYQKSRELEWLAWRRWITFQNFQRHLLVIMRSWTQPSCQSTKSGRLLVELLTEITRSITCVLLAYPILKLIPDLEAGFCELLTEGTPPSDVSFAVRMPSGFLALLTILVSFSWWPLLLAAARVIRRVWPRFVG